MTTDPIPDDILAKAKEVRALGCADPCTFDAGCGCLDAIAKALTQEREACAKIAGGYDSLAYEAILYDRPVETP